MQAEIQLPGWNRGALPLGLGTLRMGTAIPESESRDLLDTFLENGAALVDTAAVYTDWIPGDSRRVERLLGRWLRVSRKRDEVYLVSKGCHPVGEFDVATAGARVRPEMIRQELEDSLSALGTDRIDLWFLHRDDPAFPVEALVDTLNEQMRAGKLGAFGASNWTTSRIREANAYADSSGQRGFVANQMMWSLGTDGMGPIRDRSLVRMDGDMQALHESTGLLAMPYSSQAGGYFSKVLSGDVDERTKPYHTSANDSRVEWVRQMMDRHGVDATTVCLAYLWNHPFPVVPLVGPSDGPQLEASLAACRRDLAVDLWPHPPFDRLQQEA